MTPEQIAALTPEALHMEIARRLGWARIDEGIGEAIGELIGLSPVDGAIHCTRLPDWTTDISTALRLFDATNLDIGLIKFSDGTSRCTVLGKDIEVNSTTAPLAISRAWLAWKEANA